MIYKRFEYDLNTRINRTNSLSRRMNTISLENNLRKFRTTEKLYLPDYFSFKIEVCYLNFICVVPLKIDKLIFNFNCLF